MLSCFFLISEEVEMNCIRRRLFQMAKLSRGRLQNFRKQTLLHSEGGHTMMSTSYFYDSEHAPLIEKDYTLDSADKPLLEGLFTPETAAEYLSNLSEEEQKKLQAYKLEYEVTSSISTQVIVCPCTCIYNIVKNHISFILCK